jgi:uncharacterized phage-associated protein
MSHSAKAVANYFIETAKREWEQLSAMKIQKLVYFAHGWYLALYNEPLLDEKIEAWRYGPVVPSLYHEFKFYGSGNIDYATDIDAGDGFRIITPKIPNDRMLKAFLDRVWEVYGDFSAVQLSNMTHEPNSHGLQHGATLAYQKILTLIIT